MITEDEVKKSLDITIDERLVRKEIEASVGLLLDRMGIYYRCFSRLKSSASITSKLNRKGYNADYKMQDVLGVRIVLYYRDDIDIVLQQIKGKYEYLEVVRDDSGIETFKPERLNVVCRFPDSLQRIMGNDLFANYYIDTTFEIQIRTVFSEGWHEVEHDMRYKCDDSWKPYSEYSHVLNGIFATLSTCDWAIIQLFEDLAYANYKNKEWENLIRNKFRIRLRNARLDENISMILGEDNDLAKAVFRYDRHKLMKKFNESRLSIPITSNHIVQIINIDLNINEQLKDTTNELIKNLFCYEEQ